MDTSSKETELLELKQRVSELESQIASETAYAPFRPTSYYTAYYATTGFMLGIFGAMASLLFNVIGSVLTGKHPLEIIRSYLTFPLGDRVFDLPPDQNGLMLAIGCCLYLATGMVLGIPVYLALTWWGANKSLGMKFLIASVVSLAIWIINFYGILVLAAAGSSRHVTGESDCQSRPLVGGCGDTSRVWLDDGIGLSTG